MRKTTSIQSSASSRRAPIIWLREKRIEALQKKIGQLLVGGPHQSLAFRFEYRNQALFGQPIHGTQRTEVLRYVTFDEDDAVFSQPMTRASAQRTIGNNVKRDERG